MPSNGACLVTSGTRSPPAYTVRPSRRLSMSSVPLRIPIFSPAVPDLMFLGASEHGLERLAHARRVRCELELVQSEVRIAHARDLLGRVVRINFELIAVGVEKINAPRNSMINSEADRHVVLLQLTIGV